MRPHAMGVDFEYETTGDYEWSFESCVGCSSVVLTPRPADSELARIYPDHYYAYDFSSKSSLGYRIKARLDERAARLYLAQSEPGEILDIGCGDGRLLAVFEKLGISRPSLHGCEISRDAVEAGRAKGFELQHGPFDEIDYPMNTFSMIVMQQVIEHVPSPRATIDKIRRILKPGGVAVLETPNVASWDHWLFSKRYWGGYHIPRHFHLFRPDSLTSLLSQRGFAVERCQHLVSPSFWIQSLHHGLSESTILAPLRKLVHPQRPSAGVLAVFTALDLVGKTLGITSNMRLIARKV